MDNTQIPQLEQPQQQNQQAATGTSSGLVAYNLDGNVFLPKDTKYLGVMVSDWGRLKKMLTQCQKLPDNKFSNISFTLFGVAGSAFISLVSTLAAKPFGGYDTMVAIILTCIFVFSLVVGFLCLSFQSKEATHNIQSVKNVVDEMETIEKTSHFQT